MSKRNPTSRIEKILYAASFAIVVAVAGGAVALDLLGEEDLHPRIEARLDGPAWTDGTARAVPWIAENVSSHDVERVQVEVHIGHGAPVSQEIDYLPRGSSRRGVARVRADGGEPVVEIVGYRLP